MPGAAASSYNKQFNNQNEDDVVERYGEPPTDELERVSKESRTKKEINKIRKQLEFEDFQNTIKTFEKFRNKKPKS